MLKVMISQVLVILLSLIAACSSKEKISKTSTTSPVFPDSNESTFDSISNNCHYRNKEWDDTVHNFDCINQINSSIESLLLSGNSPLALKIAKLGIERFGFDSRIRINFEKSMDVFKASTIRMSEEKPLDCAVIYDRIQYLETISPDISIQTDVCPYKRSEASIIKLKNGLVGTHLPMTEPKFEKAELHNLSKQLNYSLKMNNSDDSTYFIFKGIQSTEASFRSIGFDLSRATSENEFEITVKTDTELSFKLDEACEDLMKNLSFPGGQTLSCQIDSSGSADQNHYLDFPIGQKNFEILNELRGNGLIIGGIYPTAFIYNIDFHYSNGTKTYYYLARNNNLDLRSYSPGDPQVSYEERARDSVKVQASHGNGRYIENFMIHGLNRSHIENLKEITFTFNQKLTFELYLSYLKNKKPVSVLWKTIVSKQLAKD